MRGPSKTALISASHRALHQLLDGGAILNDPFAVPILGPEAQPFVEQARNDPIRRFWVLQFAGRSLFAEEAAEKALNKGVRQIIILGAGYDTYVYRCRTGPNTRLFEVDQPATQLRKLERLARASIPVPDNLTFVSIDFEHETLADALTGAGFDPSLPSFFTWLGVVYYLTEDSVAATMRYIGSMPDAQVALDYITPLPDDMSPEVRAQAEAMIKRMAALGEPLRTPFLPEAIHGLTTECGLRVVEDLAPADIFSRLGEPFPGAHPTRGWRFLRAATPGAGVGAIHR